MNCYFSRGWLVMRCMRQYFFYWSSWAINHQFDCRFFANGDFCVGGAEFLCLCLHTYMWRVDRWNTLHALSLNIERCFATLFSRHISQTFHSQRLKIQQNHQTHYDWSECHPQIELKYFLFVSYVKMYSKCQISTTARVCHGLYTQIVT